MLQMDFHRELKQHCINEKAECEKCCMRLYCYTPPCERTDFMMQEVIEYLNIENNRMEDCNHLDHYNKNHLKKCPCSMDMSSALGYVSHQ